MKTALAAILTVLVFSSCSKLKTGFLWADTFFIQASSRYFTLSSEEKSQLKAEFKQNLNLVKSNQLVPLASTLEKFAAEVENAKTVKVAPFLKEAEPLLFGALRSFEPVFQKMMAMEAKHGFKKFDAAFEKRWKKQSEIAETSEDREEELRRRVERVIKETVEYTTPEQDQWIDAYLKEHSGIYSLEVASRRFVYDRFVSARGQEEGRKRYVARFFEDWAGVQSKDYAAAREKYQAAGRALAERILASLEAEQRENLIQNLRKRAAELKNL